MTTTPLRKEAWEDILQFVPKDTELWLPFYHDGKAGRLVRSLGYRNVVHEKDQDFFQTAHSQKMLVIDNPPYSKKQNVVDRLFRENPNRSFALLLPLGTLGRQYMRNYTKGLQVLVPRSRYNFEGRGNVPFKACWFCWNMSDLLKSDRQLLFL